jgi:dTMP kinase
MKGFFISFEGIEGSGKTTQMKLLAKSLKQMDYDVLSTKEPGGTRLGEKIRNLLLDPDNIEMDARTEILLYAADRAQDVVENIKPTLEKGGIVMADRYIDSNIAYQGYGRKLDMEMVKRINRWVIRNIWPDLTLVLDMDVKEGLERAKDLDPDKKGDRLEQEIITFHEQVREAYLQMAEDNDRFVVINAERKPHEIHQEVLKIVREGL